MTQKTKLSPKMVEVLTMMLDGSVVPVNGSQSGFFKRKGLAEKADTDIAVPYKSMMKITPLGRRVLAEARKETQQ